MSSMNEELNSMQIYKDKECIYCGRSYPETVINIEGHIHHGEPYRCIDTKECNRAKRKS